MKSYEYTNAPSVGQLADAAFTYPMALNVVASYVAVDGNARGYSKEHIAPLKKQAFLILPEDAVKATVRALDAIAAEYARALADPALSDETRGQLPGMFTAAISEAITLKFLLEGGRRENDITQDAFVYTGSRKPISPRNMDIVWAAPGIKAAEAYECKNHPMWLLVEYPTGNAPENRAGYRKTKIWLMLEFHRLLTQASWRASIGCVTLRTRERFARGIESLSGYPSELVLYSIEHFLQGKFPPALPP